MGPRSFFRNRLAGDTEQLTWVLGCLDSRGLLSAHKHRFASKPRQNDLFLLNFSSVTPTSDFELPPQNSVDGFRLCQMLLFEDARGQCLLIVRIEHGDRLLHYDRPVVKLWHAKQHCATGYIPAVA